MCIGSEYLDIDMKLQFIGLCEKCACPIMENERITRTEEGVLCEECTAAQEGVA